MTRRTKVVRLLRDFDLLTRKGLISPEEASAVVTEFKKTGSVSDLQMALASVDPKENLEEYCRIANKIDAVARTSRPEPEKGETWI